MIRTHIRRRGRPTEYDPQQHPAQALALASQGDTLAEIGERFGVSRRTVARWRADYPEFGEVLEEGREHATDLFVKRLYTLAMGYERIDKHESKLGEDGTRTTLFYRFIPPSYRAIALWLANRRTAEWTCFGNPEPPPPTPPNPYQIEGVPLETLLKAIEKLSG